MRNREKQRSSGVYALLLLWGEAERRTRGPPSAPLKAGSAPAAAARAISDPIPASVREPRVNDIGAIAALAFKRPERFVGQAIDLAGDALTPPELAAAVSRAAGRTVEYRQIPTRPCASRANS
ncbi:NmrA family NAD(P)-binding protein [Cohnella nanjingensis]|uniref:NmrA family NAD(P)-binding protein n=1 Tax=Cohnella nanjingensis TaxID=1387779 RepID=UPI001FEBF920|nr:NmrA family NAD(P)-binding protein [Cohnella nanjingensis]